jgi:hypothetical protein
MPEDDCQDGVARSILTFRRFGQDNRPGKDAFR